ncbi:hypothetical protein M569_10469, partial [Genlisea aurea]
TMKWGPSILLIAIDAAFAIGNILLKTIVGEGFNRLVFMTYRQLVAAIFLSPLAFFLERRGQPRITLKLWFKLFMSAALGATATQYLFLIGIEYTSATFACAFLNMVPVVTFMMALPLGQEVVNVKRRSGLYKVVGAMVCLGGALLLALYKGTPLLRYPNPNPHPLKMKGKWVLGSLALLAGTVGWSSWFLLQTTVGKIYPYQYSSTAIMSTFSAVQSAIICLSTDPSSSIWLPKRKSDIFIVLYTGMIGSGLCFVGMSWCVKKRGPVFTAAFSPLVQIMAAAYEIPVLREQLHLGSVLGSGVVICGLYLLLWGKHEDMMTNQEP